MWLPSLAPADVKILKSAKESLSDSLVTIVSYDLAASMVAKLKGKNFKAVITVSMIVMAVVLEVEIVAAAAAADNSSSASSSGGGNVDEF